MIVIVKWMYSWIYIVWSIILLYSCIVMIHYMWPLIDAYVCFILCDIQSNFYCMIKYLIIILLSSINSEGVYICVHRSLEDTLNMNMNTPT
jgi:hypothetical protein